MNRQAAIDILSGRRGGLGAAGLRAGLAVASLPYRAAMRLRRWAYRRRLMPSSEPPLPCISVGNLTVGGTGKTPMVAWVVGLLAEMGRRPAVLIRGYRPSGGLSDEAELLRRICHAGPGRERGGPLVVVDPDRLAGARAALAQGADVLVMDDGFQHLRLRRRLDIVLIDATDPFGFGHVLPRGLLREPLSALKDAHALVVTRSDHVPAAELNDLRRRLAMLAPRASLHAAVHRPGKLLDEGGAEVPFSALTGRRALAFCGLGNPRPFFETLRRLGADLAATEPMDDHVAYTPGVLDRLGRLAGQSGAEVLLTTQKDAVKLPPGCLPLPVWTLTVEMELVDGADELADKIRNAANPQGA